MGYDASFDALITVSKSVDKEAIIERIKDAFDIPEVWTDDKAESNFDLWFGEYAKYDEDSIYTFLAEIEPYTISGEITYTGEDASNWRHVFDSETHQWMDRKDMSHTENTEKRSRKVWHFLKNFPSRCVNRFPTKPPNRKGRCRHEQHDQKSVPAYLIRPRPDMRFEFDQL